MRFLEQRRVAQRRARAQRHHARLALAEQLAGAAQLHVLLRDFEAVVCAREQPQPLVGLGHQEAVGHGRAAPHAPAQLMQLSQTEALGVLDHHDAGVGHIHAHLDDRRGHQHVDLSGMEGVERFLLVGALHAAVHQRHAQIAQVFRAQLLIDDLGGLCVHGLALLDQRADDVDLPSRLHLRAQKAVHIAALFLGHDARLHRRASGRQLVNDRYVQIAVEYQRQRARYGRGRHDQHVGRGALFGKERALPNAEAMLLVGDDQPEMVVGHALGDQRVRADHRLPFARRDGLVGQMLVFRRERAGQQAAAYAQRLEQLLRRFVVLRGENFGGRHQRALPAAPDRGVHRGEGDGRLAAAHVALNQPRHREGRAHIGEHLVKHASLRVCRGKGQRIPVFVRARIGTVDHHALALCAAHQPQADLKEEKLLERQSAAGGGECVVIERAVGVAQRVIALAQPVSAAQRLGQRLLILAVLSVQRGENGLLEHARRYARQRLVDRLQPLARFERRADQLQLAKARLDLSVEQKFAPGHERFPEPRLVIPHRAHRVGIVADARLDHQQLAGAVNGRSAVHAHAHSRLVAGGQFAQRTDMAQIAVFARQIGEQRRDRIDAGLAQRLEARRAHALNVGKTEFAHGRWPPFLRRCVRGARVWTIR